MALRVRADVYAVATGIDPGSVGCGSLRATASHPPSTRVTISVAPSRSLSAASPLARLGSFFLSTKYAAPRDPHSFPTRRSSDLPLRRARARSRAWSRSAARGGRQLLPRSEEHTSELQSHHDIVCRLLLEKKNSTRS